MIFDTRQRMPLHLPQPVRDVIAKYLDDSTLATRPAGAQDLGSGIRALLQEYDTRLRREGRWEAHRAFWDLQLVLRGEELLGWAPLEDLRASGPFDEAADVVFLEGDGDFLALRAGGSRCSRRPTRTCPASPRGRRPRCGRWSSRSRRAS